MIHHFSDMTLDEAIRAITIEIMNMPADPYIADNECLSDTRLTPEQRENRYKRQDLQRLRGWLLELKAMKMANKMVVDPEKEEPK